jgi:uncharacterized protein (TIGR03067 family)
MVARLIALVVTASLLTPPGYSNASGRTPPRETKSPISVATPSRPVAAPPKDDKNGLEALQGTWLIVAYGDKGDPIKPTRADDDEPWVIKGNKLIIYDSIRRNDIKGIVDLKVDPSKRPAHIDIAIKGKRKGKEMEWTTYGIYSLKGDELTVCVPEKFDPWEPENRPKEFKSTSPPPGKDSGFSVYVLKKK